MALHIMIILIIISVLMICNIVTQVPAKYGNYILYFFNDSSCDNKTDEKIIPYDQSCISYNSTHSLKLNWDSYSNSLQFVILAYTEDQLEDCKDLEFSFDDLEANVDEKENKPAEGGDSSSDNTNINEGETEEKTEVEGKYKFGSIGCNGMCFGDFLIGNNNNKLNYYFTCIYNNIIETAIVTVQRYGSEDCDESNILTTTQYSGNEYCWDNNDEYSLRPLYWKDESKEGYYYEFSNKDCISGSLYLKDYHFKCNGKCHINETNAEYSYVCDFTHSGYLYINLYITLLYVLFFI